MLSVAQSPRRRHSSEQATNERCVKWTWCVESHLFVLLYFLRIDLVLFWLTHLFSKWKCARSGPSCDFPVERNYPSRWCLQCERVECLAPSRLLSFCCWRLARTAIQHLSTELRANTISGRFYSSIFGACTFNKHKIYTYWYAKCFWNSKLDMWSG